MKVATVTKVKRVPRNTLTTSRVAPARRNTHPVIIHTKAFEQGISQTSTPDASEDFLWIRYHFLVLIILFDSFENSCSLYVGSQ